MGRKLGLISVVVPCFNEESCIAELYHRMVPVLTEVAESYEILFINDGSRDRTLEIMRQLKAQDSKVGYLSFTRNFGHEAGLTCGIANTKGDAVVLIDADLQDPPEVIRDLVRRWEQGFEIVYAQRRSRAGEKYLTLLTSSLFYRVYNKLAHVEMPVDTGDFRLMDAAVVRAFCALPERNRYVRGMISWTGYKQTGVLYDRDARYAGETKYRFYNRASLAFDAICAISNFPLRLITLCGFALTILALGIVSWIVIQKISNGLPLRGYALLATGLYFFGGVQLFFLGLIGEYVGRIYRETQNRPLFILGEAALSEQKARRKKVA